MKKLRNQIMDYLLRIPNINKENLIGILNPLDTEEQAMIFLNYLQKNQNNEEKMQVEKLIKTVLKITGKI